MANRRIEIPKGIRCPNLKCGSTNLRGRGTDWRLNPNGGEPYKVKVQMLICKDCGKIFSDGEVKNQTGGKA